jgi:hypothetical protein
VATNIRTKKEENKSCKSCHKKRISVFEKKDEKKEENMYVICVDILLFMWGSNRKGSNQDCWRAFLVVENLKKKIKKNKKNQ